MIGKVIGVGFTPFGGTKSVAQKKIACYLNIGIKEDSHGGPTRLLDARVDVLSKRKFAKQEMLNYRQLSIVSVEESLQILSNLGKDLPHILKFGWNGENILIEGISNLSEVGAGHIVLFKDGNSYRNCSLFVTGKNNPCEWPGHNFIPEAPHTYQKAAMNIRGITAMVFTPGKITPGDQVEIVSWK